MRIMKRLRSSLKSSAALILVFMLLLSMMSTVLILSASADENLPIVTNLPTYEIKSGYENGIYILLDDRLSDNKLRDIVNVDLFITDSVTGKRYKGSDRESYNNNNSIKWSLVDDFNMAVVSFPYYYDELTSDGYGSRIRYYDFDFKNSDIEVVLFHDYNKYTYAILGDAIDYLEKKDYILLPLFYESVMVNK